MVQCTKSPINSTAPCRQFGGSNYEFGQNCGVHIEPGPHGGIVVLDDTTIYDMAIAILEEQQAAKDA